MLYLLLLDEFRLLYVDAYHAGLSGRGIGHQHVRGGDGLV